MRSFLFLTFLLSSISLAAQESVLPVQPPRLVNDFAGLLSEFELLMLEDKLKNFYDTSSTHITVVTVNSTNGEDVDAYTTKLSEDWQVGENGEKGVLVFVALAEKKVRIATGPGLETSISDSDQKRIIGNYIVPKFEEKRYFEGLDQSTSIIMSLAAGELSRNGFTDGIGMEIYAAFLLLVAILLYALLKLLKKTEKKQT